VRLWINNLVSNFCKSPWWGTRMKTKLDRPWQMRLLFLGLVGVAAMFAAAAYFSGPMVWASNEHVHLATDWSHRHMIFSTPKTWWQSFNLSRNPRYVQQWVRRNAEKKNFKHRPPHREEVLKGDWSNYIGGNATTVATAGPGVFPAKFSFDVTTASCADDFVVTGTNLAGSVTPVSAFDRLTVAAGATGSTITIRSVNLVTTLTLTGGATNANTGPLTGTWVIDPNATTEASNIAASINAIGNGNVVGVSASSTGPVVTITALLPGAAANAILLGGDVNGASTGLTADNLNLQDGASDTVSIAAFNDLYVGCFAAGVSSPQPAWAYNTGGLIKTSVSLSFDGTQVAFVQTIGGVANLSVLKWAVGSSVNAGVDVAPVLAAAYRACVPTSVAPCLVNIPFSSAVDDTRSSPFYDFGSDTIYVGDDADNLHKFTGIFGGTPAEVITGWPVNLQFAGETILTTSPVFDSTSGRIFIADAESPVSFDGGWFYAVTASTGVVAKSFAADAPGVLDSPMVDGTSEQVYLFSPVDGHSALNSSVIEYAANFADGDAAVTIQTIGLDNPNSNVFSGNFDNAFYSGGAGNLYVCGNATATNIPTLYQIPVSSVGLLGTPNQGPALTTAAATCSPVTEFFNPDGGGAGVPKDWVFLSVTDLGQTATPINCPAHTGCIMSFDVTSGAAISPSTATAATPFSVPGGASGVIVDNSVLAGSGTSASPGGTSQIYYTPLGVGDCTTLTGIGGCLVQISQATLR
jgi:hypothetical protein